MQLGSKNINRVARKHFSAWKTVALPVDAKRFQNMFTDAQNSLRQLLPAQRQFTFTLL